MSRRKGPLPRPLSERFWEKAKTGSAEECWEWTASTYSNGYGHIGLGRGLGGALAHRMAWVLTQGPIPDGQYVCHRCDNPRCVNPAHLFLGSQGDNMRDAKQKGRVSGGRMPGDKNPNAKLSPSQVIAIRKRYAQRDVYQSCLAEEYGVSQAQISSICRGESWACLEAE